MGTVSVQLFLKQLVVMCHVFMPFFFTVLNGLLFFIIENVIVTIVLRISADDFIRSKCYVLYVIKVNLLILNMNR